MENTAYMITYWSQDGDVSSSILVVHGLTNAELVKLIDNRTDDPEYMDIYSEEDLLAFVVSKGYTAELVKCCAYDPYNGASVVEE